MPTIDQVRLGKLPKQSDSRTVFLPGLLSGEAAGTPEEHFETRVTDPWGEMGNDRLGDCAIAAAGHAEMLWAALYGGTAFTPSDDQIKDAYSKITGYDPAQPASDKGADLLTVLKYWQKTGIADRKIGAYAEIPPRDIDTIRWSIQSFGVAYIGFGLPASLVSPVDPTREVEFTTRHRAMKPSTWQNLLNGHCVLYTGYTASSFTCVSWGRVMQFPVAFHRHYCDEAYAVIPPERMSEVAGLDWRQFHDAVDRALQVQLS